MPEICVARCWNARCALSMLDLRRRTCIWSKSICEFLHLRLKLGDAGFGLLESRACLGKLTLGLGFLTVALYVCYGSASPGHLARSRLFPCLSPCQCLRCFAVPRVGVLQSRLGPLEGLPRRQQIYMHRGSAWRFGLVGRLRRRGQVVQLLGCALGGRNRACEFGAQIVQSLRRDQH